MSINIQNLAKWFKSSQFNGKKIFAVTGLVAFFLFLTGAFIIYKESQSKHKITNIANLSIEESNGINLNDIQVKWYRANSNGILTDSLMFTNKKNGIVPHATGENCFAIYYNNELIKVFGHYVYSTAGLNKYLLKVWIEDNIINCSLIIEGPDSYTSKVWSEMFNLSYLIWPKHNSEHSLVFNSDSSKVKNIIDFTLSQKDFERITSPKVDTCIEKLTVVINGSSLNASKIKTRGHGSLAYPRKCYNVNMKKIISFRENNKFKNLKTFSLISLSMDNFYFRNKIALDLLKKLHIINTYFSFCELRINEKTQGVYLLIENSKEHLLDSLKSPFILRRGYENSNFNRLSLIGSVKSHIKDVIGRAYDYNTSKDLKSHQSDQYLKQYKTIYKLIKKEKGEKLLKSLQNIMDIKGYMRLMAFNYLICNHDYTDEQFFFINGLNKNKIFYVFPWDFDDIFSISPHEGWSIRNKLLKEKLIFSGEDYLDLAIANDSYLYMTYLNELTYVLNELSESDLKRYFQNIYTELFAFYTKKVIIEQSKYDQFGIEYNLTDFQKQLEGSFLFLSQRIRTSKSRAEKELQLLKSKT